MIAAINEADGFAISMLLILALSFGFVLVILVAIFRQARKRDRELEEFLDGIDEPAPKNQPAGPPAKNEPRREPWEKPDDWWKN